jgi:hypothetical protein
MRNLSNGLRLSWLPALLLAFGLIPANAFADLFPGDPAGGSCGLSGINISLDVFENSTSQPTNIGNCVQPGTVALLEDGAGANVPSNWSDLAVFAFDGTNYTVTLLAPSQFGSFTSADLAIPENSAGVTIFNAGCITTFCVPPTSIEYLFHSPEEVPEPPTLSLVGLGLAVAFCYGLKASC